MARLDTRTVYKFEELSDEAKKRARNWYRDATAGENDTLDEMMDSLKALLKTAGVKAIDWSIGPGNRGNFLNVDMGDAGELASGRAMAWLENNLIGKLRVTHAEYARNRKEWHGYGYRPGRVKDCPFTGVCYDEDLLDALRGYVRTGDNLKEAFERLGDVVARMNENEIEYLNSDDAIDETLIANEYEFTENGKRI